MSAATRIGLVSPSHLASNPPLVKEAEALCDAGFDVHVVSGQNHPITDRLEKSVMAHAPWRTHRLDFRPSFSAKLSRLRQLIALRRLRRFSSNVVPLALARTAHSTTIERLAKAARSTESQLFIGHTIAGLAAAAWAAQRSGASFAFDAEDFHTGETDAVLNDSAQHTAIRVIEETLLPQAIYLTAAAPLIADAYADLYPLESKPISMLNVFPRTNAPANPVRPTDDGVFRLY
ncbi:MAG: hypothetical protein J6386_05420 [Candidatus Synoicihabitans palmerolidicus]|nr:hypothetical protein [Candidatus Synoicihabitans palmerolidicus]